MIVFCVEHFQNVSWVRSIYCYKLRRRLCFLLIVRRSTSTRVNRGSVGFHVSRECENWENGLSAGDILRLLVQLLLVIVFCHIMHHQSHPGRFNRPGFWSVRFLNLNHFQYGEFFFLFSTTTGPLQPCIGVGGAGVHLTLKLSRILRSHFQDVDWIYSKVPQACSSRVARALQIYIYKR